MKLLDVGVGQAGFLPQFPPGPLLSRFIHVEETAGKCPVPLVWLYAALYEKHVERRTVETEYHAVGRDRRMWIAVAVLIFLHDGSRVFWLYNELYG